MIEKDKTRITIEDLLKSHTEGLTIQEIMNSIGLARHTVLSRLHQLVGEGKVKIRQINMAKLHYWDTNAPPSEKEITEVLGKGVSKKIIEQKEEIKVQPIMKENIKQLPSKNIVEIKHPKVNMIEIKRQIQDQLQTGKINKEQGQLLEQRKQFEHILDKSKHKSRRKPDEYIKIGIPGFDELFEFGIPKGSAVLLAGGAGSGKTIFGLQTLYNHALDGDKCFYMSFEESEERLIHHMEDFGWDVKELINKGNLIIKRFNPFDITRNVDAMLLKAKGELLIDVEPIIFPKNFKPNITVVDSLTAIASAFIEKEDSYRVYTEQLFRFFEKAGANSFLITETKQVPTIFSQSGVEEFLADGVIVLYNIKKGNIRENAIEVLKMRGADHEKKIVAMQITDNGIVVYPEQELFEDIKSE